MAETTPNMLLELPIEGETVGPDWATMVRVAMEVVDAHDHTDGKGHSVPNSAVEYVADSILNGYGLFGTGFLAFAPGATLPTGVQFAELLYVGSDGELYYRDGASHSVKLTLNGALHLTANRGINGDYPTDVATPSLFYTTTSKRYTLTSNGSTLASLRTGGLYVGVKALAPSASYTITDTDGVAVVACDTSSGTGRTVVLPAAANNPGRKLIVKDQTGNCATRNITVARAGSDTIDGATSVVLSLAYDKCKLVSDGVSRWMVL